MPPPSQSSKKATKPKAPSTQAPTSQPHHEANAKPQKHRTASRRQHEIDENGMSSFSDIFLSNSPSPLELLKKEANLAKLLKKVETEKQAVQKAKAAVKHGQSKVKLTFPFFIDVSFL
jgi:hypothetical protein